MLAHRDARLSPHTEHPNATDPLGLGKDPAKYARYQVSEIKNGYVRAL